MTSQARSGTTVLTDLTQVLTTTRSVRLRLDYDRPVPLDVVGECLQLALQAPTGGAAEDWRWLVVADPALKAELAALYFAGYDEYVYQPLHGAAGTEDEAVAGRLGGVAADGSVNPRTQRILDGADHLARNIGRAPYLVIPCATRPDPAKGGAGTTSAFYGSLYPAIWQFNLALRARGLGTCITSLHLHHAEQAAALLGIPDDAVQITMLPIAYTLGTDFKVAARKPVADVAYLDGWGTPLPYDERPFG
ncbi:nitroreductase [Nocardioides marmoriginsengisoli]|uniref:Nitroreductase n=1 Tax=Nocardioides marmoriginsengisoli TaxID=661483 RepID=A0A3N0CES0_9ACTN|nr:nitroreductase family protein [Nocardioides marmoriginsengisoli]RNL61928.1 nitroreductase [Nocardioides marmoriginsengisoli]